MVSGVSAGAYEVVKDGLGPRGTEFVKVAHMAEAFDVPVSSHLFSETSLQVLGGLANANYLEYMPWFSALYNEKLQFDQGKALVPERPGWGVTFNWDYIKSLEPC